MLLVGAACNSQVPVSSTALIVPTAGPKLAFASPSLPVETIRSATPPPVTPQIPLLNPSPSPTRRLAEISTGLPTPTAAILRGQVLVDTSCHYGPGVQYLYKYALIAGSNLEVIGRDETGTQLLVRAIGGNNPCWVKASRMAVAGDLHSLATIYLPLPQSPYYGPPTGVSARRTGNVVTISWNGLTLREGDDSGQYPYLVEAWICRAGRMVFTPVGTYQTNISLLDEPSGPALPGLGGCPAPSHARLAAAEKHGYTRWVDIPWPSAFGMFTPPPN